MCGFALGDGNGFGEKTVALLPQAHFLLYLLVPYWGYFLSSLLSLTCLPVFLPNGKIQHV
jgi:hypothetical protein